jgi:hypothetical protein
MLNFKKKEVKDDSHLASRIIILEQKVKELEELLKAVKQVSGELKKQSDFHKKNKWLNGYPDESAGKQ